MPTSRGYQEIQPGHLAALKARHAEISDQIEQEQLRPAASDEEIMRLKREKLKIKDEIILKEQD